MLENRVSSKGIDSLLFAYIGFLFLNILEAYAIKGIPIPWIAMALIVVLAIIHRSLRGMPTVFGTSFFWLLFIWLGFVTFLNVVLGIHDIRMPSESTSSFGVFIALRFITLLSVVYTIRLVYHLCQKGYFHEIVRWTVLLGTVSAIFALYVYFAQMTGLPEPPRTRIGTGVQGQSTYFNFEIHRAMGSFREPSLLAQWLILPFFLSLMIGKKNINIHSALIGGALLLSGSFTGFIASATGILASSILNITSPKQIASNLSKLLIPILLGLILVTPFAVRHGDLGRQMMTDPFLVISALWSRADKISQGDSESSSRGYIFEYFQYEPVPPFGNGLGIASIIRSGDRITSWLNVYFNLLYSGGFIAVILLLLFLCYPLYLLGKGKIRSSPMLFFLLAGYCSWFFLYAAQSEELNLFYGINYALLIFMIQEAAATRPGQ